LEEQVKKTFVYGLITGAAIVVLAGVFSGGFVVGRTLPAGSILLPALGATASETGTPAELRDTFEPFWETWAIVHQQYVDQPVDDLALMRGAISGMLAALGDEHTTYMDPDEWESANTQLQGSWEGIGAYVDPKGEYLTIISAIPGSPSEQAGLKPGDEIVAVDGEDMTGIDPQIVRKKVVGPAGSSVILSIQREGMEQVFDVTLTREKIVIPSVEHEMLADGIAYVKINDFGGTTGEDLKAALLELMPQEPKGLVLDLRNDPGGYLTAAVEVGSQFIKEGDVVLYEQFGDGSRKTYLAEAGGLALDVPIVVLINGGSASASELVAGALQDYGLAPLVGEQSYGKGSVQNWIPLSGEQGGVRVTIAKWLTPKERGINKVGLTPDVVVPFSDEDIDAGRDPQLDAAIDILLQGH
jgi:carboxyl-terminal processing protease